MSKFDALTAHPFDLLNGRSTPMLEKILIPKRGDSGREAVAAKPDCMMRAAHAGDLDAENRHV